MATWIEKVWNKATGNAEKYGSLANPFSSGGSKKELLQYNFKGTNIEIPVAYGECILPAIWVGARQVQKDRWAALAVFCHGPVEDIEWVEVNGVRRDDLYMRDPSPVDYDDYVSNRNGQSQGLTDVYDDHGTVFAPYFNGVSSYDGSVFARDHSGYDLPPEFNGVEPYFFHGLVGVSFEFNPSKGLVSGFPDVSIKVKGRNYLFDPRVDASPSADPLRPGTTTTACTNPALIKADYMTNPYYGKGISWDQINMQALIDKANVCDTQVLDGDGNNIALMSFSGRIDTANKIDANINLINKHMRGHSVYENGQFKFLIRDDYSNPETIPERWIIKHGEIKHGEKSERLNQCIVTYQEPEYDLDDNQVSWPITGSADHLALLAEDGGEVLTEEITLEGCRNRYQAIDYAESIVRESRLQLETTVELLAPAIKYSAGDVVDIPLKGVGLTRVRITEVKERANHTVQWSVREHSNDSYPWTTKTSTPLPAKDVTNPVSVEAPQNVIFTPDVYNEFSAGVLTWDAIDNPMVKEYKVTITSTDNGRIYNTLNTAENVIDIPGLPSGNYSISVRAVLSLTHGPVTSIAVLIVVPIIDPISGLTVTDFSGPDCAFKWNAPANAIFTVHNYVIEIRDNDTDAEIFTDTTTETSYVFDYASNKASGLHRKFKIKVYAQGKYGQDNVDTGADTAVAENTLPGQLSGFSLSSNFEQIKVSYNQVTDPDFNQIKVWLSESESLIPSDSNKRFSTRSNTFDFRDLESNKKYYLYYSVLDAFHEDTAVGVLSSQFVIYTAPDALKEARESIEGMLALDDQQALNELIATDNTIVNRREVKAANSRILEVEVVTDGLASRLELAESGLAQAGVLLEALENNGSTQANAALFVDVDGALAGVFTSANNSTSDIVFKAENFRFLTDSGSKTPLSVSGDDVIIDNAIVKSSINVNNKFIVDSDGNLSAVDAVLSGQLVAPELVGGIAKVYYNQSSSFWGYPKATSYEYDVFSSGGDTSITSIILATFYFPMSVTGVVSRNITNGNNGYIEFSGIIQFKDSGWVLQSRVYSLSNSWGSWSTVSDAPVLLQADPPDTARIFPYSFMVKLLGSSGIISGIEAAKAVQFRLYRSNTYNGGGAINSYRVRTSYENI